MILRARAGQCDRGVCVARTQGRRFGAPAWPTAGSVHTTGACYVLGDTGHQRTALFNLKSAGFKALC